MKGFRLLGINTIHPINDPSGFDWYGDHTKGYAPYILNDQCPDGAWCNPADWSSHPLTSAWAILTLKKTVVQPGPVADAGPDVPNHPPLIEITFDGTGSYHRDPSRSIVQYVWDFGDGSAPVLGSIVTHAFPAVYNPDGTIDWVATTRDYMVTLTVTDDSSPALSDTDTCIVHITPPLWPPVADAKGPYAAYQSRTITLDGSRSYDPNGLFYPDPSHPWHGWIVSWEWDLDNDGEYDDAIGETTTWSSCELGIHVVGLKVTNNFGDSDETDTTIDVTETPPNEPPDVSNAYPIIGCLWPPNHKFVDETIQGVIDPDRDPVTITITKITSDEPTASIAGAGGAKHAPDAYGVGTSTASLRAERSGNGNGRVYEITFVASDGKGGETEGSVTVCVPHDGHDACTCIDDGQNYDATQIN